MTKKIFEISLKHENYSTFHINLDIIKYDIKYDNFYAESTNILQ